MRTTEPRLRGMHSYRYVALALVALPLVGVRAQGGSMTQQPAYPESAVRAAVPFEAGERLTYEIRYGPFKVGSGHMEVLGTEDVRGREAWRTRFTVKGGVPGFRVNDRLESWFDTRTLESLRFIQDLEEGKRDRERKFEIFPERGTFREGDEAEAPSVEDPLDDAAFLYFVRTMPLEVGKTYELNRYFRPDRNPVRLKVLRRETVEVPAGKFETIVVEPVIKSKGIFSEKGHAELWLTDDSRRLMVQMKTHMSIGSLTLQLKSHQPGVPQN
jgi:hypothetical protein